MRFQLQKFNFFRTHGPAGADSGAIVFSTQFAGHAAPACEGLKKDLLLPFQNCCGRATQKTAYNGIANYDNAFSLTIEPLQETGNLAKSPELRTRPKTGTNRKTSVRRFGVLAIPVLLLQAGAFSQKNVFPIVRTPAMVSVNTSLPNDVLPPEAAMPARFSKVATDNEIFNTHFFEEPLVPTAGTDSLEENNSLVFALIAFSQRKDPENFSAITQFLKVHPKSRWQGALLANLGILYRRTGYYDKALAAWKKSWEILEGVQERKAKLLADKVISELLLIHAWVGRAKEMEMYLKSIENRVIEGPANERISAVKEAFWQMRNKPGISFKCGPFALNRLVVQKDSTIAFDKKLMDVQSTTNGFSLAELAAMALGSGLKYQMAFRNPGAEIITNAVVHWKLDHYSALLKEENGHYKCEDATMGTVYGQQFWLSAEALDSSASGYFLVPVKPLPAGWRKVSFEEGSKVFGKGVEPPDKGKHVGDDDKKEPDCKDKKPMAQSNVHLAAVSLHIFDRPLYYTPPKGPEVVWDMSYHQRDSYQPANFSYSNLGPKWTFKWLSYVQDDPNNPNGNADVYLPGGGVKTFTAYNATTLSYGPELQSNDILVRVCPNCYELRHPDGSKEVYARPDGSTINGRKIFLTKRVDVAGNEVTLSYDGSLRIVGIKDALGQVSTIRYQLASDIYKVTKVIDPFGRFTSFKYDDIGRLISITDMIGIVSSFTYNETDFIKAMTTPYGTTEYISTEGPGSSRSIETHYPLGQKERVEFLDNAPDIPFSESIYPTGMNLFNSYMTYRNTFYWDKKAMQDAPYDYTKAKLYHWLHGSPQTNESNSVSPVLESIKEPLENRVWYNYANQPWPAGANQGMSRLPAIVGRVLDDGTTQLNRYTYNEIGAVTKWIDPVGRTVEYTYDSSKINLLQIAQTTNGANEVLLNVTYNSQHRPLTVKDASGQATVYTYNSAGQMTSYKNAKKETTTLTYDSKGYLTSINGPVAGATTTFTYDGFGRVRTRTDKDGYTITTDYDELDRPTVVTYPDNTFVQYVYDRLDLVHVKDRLGRWSHSIYDSLDRPTVSEDALGRVTQYFWCNCGSVSRLVDPQKNVTSFSHDLQGRLVAKTYNSGQKTLYKYENTTSRLKSITDAKGQQIVYDYYIDDDLKKTEYVNALVPTPAVTFTYEDNYNRVSTMTDGTGVTKYAYYPVNGKVGSGLLQTVDGPLNNDVIKFNYDALGRVTSSNINGIASSMIYDSLGRITSATNPLGTFDYTYQNFSNRILHIGLPNGQTTDFDYFGTAGDERLKQIVNKLPNSNVLSKFGYDYNAASQITKWTQQVGSGTPSEMELSYNLNDELTSATQKNQSTSVILKRFAYQYDSSGNRISEQLDNSATGATYNSLNQLNNFSSSGLMRFKGSVSEFSSVLVKNASTNDSSTAAVDTSNFFEAFVKVKPGINNIKITATDYSGNNNSTVNNTPINVSAGSTGTFTYDANGNLTSSTVNAATYEWDGADRLVKIVSGGTTTEFVYDGLNRRVAEKINGTVKRRWLWNGLTLSEERNAGGSTVLKRFFIQGEQIQGTPYYYTYDHLGSIREMTDANGAIKARYDYDPYGRQIKLTGTMDADFGFAGMFAHPGTGLHLALWRAYNSATGRWLSRDPMDYAEFLPEGPNLYAYVGNNPVNMRDELGLYTTGSPVPIGPTANSIICKGGKLTVQNNNAGPGKECTQAHEENHMKDWIARYGPNLCNGVPDGQLPVGGPGYDDFLKKSECDSYKVGKKCRENKLKGCPDKNTKKTLEDEIKRDDAQMASVCS